MFLPLVPGKSSDDVQGVNNPSSSLSQKGVVENKVDSSTSDKTGQQQLKSTTLIATTTEQQQPPEISKLCKDPAPVTPAAATAAATATAAQAQSQESPSRPAF